jgi:MATE family multidrug resistance protein
MTSIPDTRPAPFFPRLWQHLGALGTLAWPVMLSRAGILAMALADVIMLGRYSTQALGEASVSLALFIPIMVTGVGLQMGVISLVARRHGAGRAGETVDVWLRALPWAALSGGIGTVLMGMGELWLWLIGQSPALVAGGGAFSLWVAPGVLFQVLYVTCAFYLEGTGRPKPALMAMVVANLLNIALNWVLIYGNLGMPELGAIGSAAGTSLVRVFLFLAVFLYILRLPEVRDAGGLRRFTGLWGPGGWGAGGEMRRLGYAAGLSVFFETSALGALTQMAGWLGPVALAAYSIAHNAETTVFMVALGLSVATGVRVGRATGAGDQGDARFAGFTGLCAGAALMGLIGLALMGFGDRLASVYTDDAQVIAAAALLLPVVAVVVVPNGGQIVMGQCNRAMGDAYVASALYLVAYWLVMVPLGWLLAFDLGMGAAGLLWATGIGAGLSLMMQGTRFMVLTGRAARP